MTIPAEEKHALIYAREFLLSLLDPKETPRIPRAIRQEAGRRLRHYPGSYKIERMYEKEVSDWEEMIGIKPKTKDQHNENETV